MHIRTGSSRTAVRWGALAAVAVALALTACAIAPVPASSTAAAPSDAGAASGEATRAVPERGARDAAFLGTALQYALVADGASFSDEPKGDLKFDGFARVYAHISRVSTSPASITFDVAQYYPEAQAAREAAKDRAPAPDQGGYERDAYRHAQTAVVATGTGVIGQFADPGDITYGAEGVAQFSAIDFAEFAKRFAAPGSGLPRAGYWIGLDSEGVRTIVRQYEP